MLNNGYTFIADGRQYTVIEQLGSGANTVVYLAQCSHGELVTKCILKEYAHHDNDDIEVGKGAFHSFRQYAEYNTAEVCAD